MRESIRCYYQRFKTGIKLKLPWNEWSLEMLKGGLNQGKSTKKYLFFTPILPEKDFPPLWSPVIKLPLSFLPQKRTCILRARMKWCGRLSDIPLFADVISQVCVWKREGKRGRVSEWERVRWNNKQLFILTTSVRQDCARFPPRGLDCFARASRNVTDCCVHLVRHSLMMALSSSSPPIIQISSVNNWRDNAWDEVVAGG